MGSVIWFLLFLLPATQTEAGKDDLQAEGSDFLSLIEQKPILGEELEVVDAWSLSWPLKISPQLAGVGVGVRCLSLLAPSSVRLVRVGLQRKLSERIDTFELWCWRRLLRVPWTARRSNQCILKEISPEYSLEGLMLKLKLQYFGPLMRTDSLEKTLMLGKIEGRRKRGRQRMRWLDGITYSMQALGVGDGQGRLACCSPWGCKWLDTIERLN